MLGKDPGVVNCGHCRQPGATSDCPACGRLICPSCAANWTSCETPIGRRLRLGIGARLRDVDASGRFGLVSRVSSSAVRLVDLRRLCWVTPVARLALLELGQEVEQLTPDGRILSWHVQSMADGSLRTGFDLQRLASPGGAHYIERVYGNRVRVARDGEFFWFIGDDESVTAVDLAPPFEIRCRYRAPAGTVTQAAWISWDDRLLAIGSWGHVSLLRLEGDETTLLTRLRVVDGDVMWLAMGGEHLAVVINGDPTTIVVWRIDGDGAATECFRRAFGCWATTASITPNGRWLAVGLEDQRVAVHDVAGDQTVYFEDLTDRPCLVRFVDRGRQLVMADEDNRVVVRPRVGGSFTGRLMAVDLPRRARRIEPGPAVS